MNWDLEGLIVSGTYLDEIFVQGKVTLSRVAYGGDIHHHVKLDKPINVYGAIRDTVILDHKQITQVSSH